MIIDMHVHIFKDSIAKKAHAKLTGTAQIPCYTDLTEQTTRQKLDEWGVGLGVVLPIATKPSQQAVINDWAKTVQHGNLICFGTVHPNASDALSVLDTIKEYGFYGVKLHPDYQDFFPDEEKYFPLYEKTIALDLPVSFHAGFDPVSPDVIHASPERIRNVIKTFPDLKLIAAHLGGHMQYDEAEKYIVGLDTFIDISMAPPTCPQDQFERIIKNHGIEKVLFGSDCPWTFPDMELDMLRKAHLTQDEMDQILYKNAQKLLKLG
ncbi:amidohydrolase family protein [Christensenellaceae bacterium OttesenSCG-928-K19]|nr:amidohydrolase family protein [Christensenellaceae bacterium OttesenSCG-928-K19]